MYVTSKMVNGVLRWDSVLSIAFSFDKSKWKLCVELKIADDTSIMYVVVLYILPFQNAV